MAEAKSANAFRTISEVAEEIGVPQHVLRFWETKFPAIRPLKRGGNRRYYRPEDVTLLRAINRLLYTEGYTIRGVQKLIKERGVRAFMADPIAPDDAEPTTGAADLFEPAQPDEAPVDFGPAELAELRAVRDLLAAALADARR